jgi:hypothetical protein
MILVATVGTMKSSLHLLQLSSGLVWMVRQTSLGLGLAVVVLLFRIAAGPLSRRGYCPSSRIPIPPRAQDETLGEIPVFVWALQMTHYNGVVLSGHVWINPGLLTVSLVDVLEAYVLLVVILAIDLLGRVVASRADHRSRNYRFQFGTVVACLLPLFDCASAVGPFFFGIATGGW